MEVKKNSYDERDFHVALVPIHKKVWKSICERFPEKAPNKHTRTFNRKCRNYLASLILLALRLPKTKLKKAEKEQKREGQSDVAEKKRRSANRFRRGLAKRMRIYGTSKPVLIFNQTLADALPNVGSRVRRKVADYLQKEPKFFKMHSKSRRDKNSIQRVFKGVSLVRNSDQHNIHAVGRPALRCSLSSFASASFSDCGVAVPFDGCSRFSYYSFRDRSVPPFPLSHTLGDHCSIDWVLVHRPSQPVLWRSRCRAFPDLASFDSHFMFGFNSLRWHQVDHIESLTSDNIEQEKSRFERGPRLNRKIGQRGYHCVVQMRSEARKHCLRFDLGDGQPLERPVEIDLKSGYFACLTQRLPDTPGRVKLIELLEQGSFYQYLADASDGKFSRDDIKKKAIKHLLFGKREFGKHEVFQVLRREMPDVAAFILRRRKGTKYSSSKFAFDLMGIEARFILDRVLPKLFQAQIPAIPLHDGLMVSERDSEAAAKICSDCAADAFGFRAKFGLK